MKAHPAADLLPSMSDDEFAALKVGIAAQGLIDPIVVHLGTVLDGRHRLRACEELGIEPRFEDFNGGDPIEFVLAKNTQRRHLTPSQRAAVAVEAEAMFKAQAEKRMKAGKKAADPSPDRGQGSDKGKALAQAAKALDVGRGTAERAKAVKAADPELFEKVKRGEVAVDQAAKQVKAATAYQQAVTDFPFLGPDESPGVPETEVIDIADGLRRIPDGSEREARIDAAKRWHRKYTPQAVANAETAARNAKRHKAAAEIVAKVSAALALASRAGERDAFDGLDLPEFEQQLWHEQMSRAADLFTACAKALAPKLRRVK